MKKFEEFPWKRSIGTERGYNSKYDRIIEKADALHNFDGLILLVGVQNELNIVSAPGEVAWAYAYARSKGYKGVPDIE